MSDDNEKTYLSKLLDQFRKEKNNNKLKIVKKHLLEAGRIIRNIEYLPDNDQIKQEKIKKLWSFLDKTMSEDVGDFNASVKCTIINKCKNADGSEKSLKDWSYAKFSAEVQDKVYSFSKKEFENFKPSKAVKDVKECLSKLNILSRDCITNGQYYNIVINNAKNTYEGMIDKINNHNNKIDYKIEIKSSYGGSTKALEKKKKVIFNDDGTLKEKPGINYNIFLHQGCLKVEKPAPKEYLPKEYHNCIYSFDIQIKDYTNEDRLNIPKGQPGYVADHHREQLIKNKNGRVRMTNNKSGAIPLLIK